ncbi:MAG: N-acetyl-gamma-glutamyl-phosphate reductase [Elusimicrobiota bacterium]
MKAAVIGATGITGGELIRILISHRGVELNGLLSKSSSGKNINEIHPWLKGRLSQELVESAPDNVPTDTDVVFLALPHTKSIEYVCELMKRDKIVIDLSADYRLKDARAYKKWYKVEHNDTENLKKSVYGIPEIYRKQIKQASLIANPGCYATAVILSLYPLFKDNIVDGEIFVDAKTGISGAGKKLDKSYLFYNRYENTTPYNVNNHRHIEEIKTILKSQSQDSWKGMVFCPQMVPMERGILICAYAKVKSGINKDDIKNSFFDAYSEENFVNVYEEGKFPQTKEVVYTNNCNIGYKFFPESGSLIVIGAIDNLVKGASGQAVQNMNVLLGLNENEGLV